ncbi:MAG TPA: 50S ribosomal protein L25 [Acidimicrobiales bacterium]|nr:50S ribosomal protein L25 [Acidimicrobiales bacterium]
MASSEVTLTAEIGRQTGSAASRRMRRDDHIPGVVYGQGAKSQSVSVARRDLRVALSGPAGLNALITLEVGGDPQLTIVRDLQRDPIKRVVTHVDFLRINRDEEIEVEVPLHLEGEATEVIRNDGLVDQALTTITVIAKPGDIPPSFTIDVSEMVIGDVIRVHDLSLPAGVVTPLDPETPLVTADATRATIEEEAAAEGEEGEGAEGEGGGAAESAESAGGDEG